MPAACLVCGSTDVSRLLARRATPIFQNAVYDTVAAAKAAARGDLDFRRCGACGFTRNEAFADERLTYSPDYENRQALSPAFQAHLESRAQATLALIGGRSKATVVEVGCGQGDFLATLRRAGPDARLHGFDPAWRGADGDGPAGARVHRRLFDENEPLDGRPADLIVSRHVIEHVSDPIGFLAVVRRAAGPATRIAIETPDIDWILRTGAYHDFFYEHCSLFSLAALDLALRRTGFAATRLERVFDGQYLWAEAVVDATPAAPSLGDYERRWKTALARATKAGPVVVWGAGAKGASFVQIFDADASRIAAVVDVNPAKQNRRLGGGGHIVLAPEAATAIAPRTVFVMNPNYEAEIAALTRSLGWGANIVVIN